MSLSITLLTVAATVSFAADVEPVSSVAETNFSLLATPTRCVALHQGQVCYQRVHLVWRGISAGNYCLAVLGQPEPLQCWQQQTQGSAAYDFASAESQVVQLRAADEQVLASVNIEVAWVYKTNTRRKTHWRLF